VANILTFSDFAKMLYPFCGGGNKTSDFVLSLFTNMMEDPSNDDDVQKDLNDEYNPFAAMNISTLEKFYNGNRKISKPNAGKVIAHLDKGKFEDYIGTLPVDTIGLLKEALRARGYDASDFDVPNTCADIFASILENCVNPNVSLVTSTTILPVTSNLNNAVPDSDLYLLMEANSLCPSCGKPLVSEKNSISLSGYKITDIIPPHPSEEQLAELGELIDGNSEVLNRKIALCLECSNRYTSHTTREECAQLIDIKNRLHRNYVAFETLDKMYLEEQIEAVIRQIPGASQEQLSDILSYKALRVREKIIKSNIPLIIKTEGFVVPYYKFIKSLFSQLEREGLLHFEDVANDVQRSYRRLHTSGLTQDEIFQHLVDWFKNKTNAQSILACEIIVAFFVQNCEVFHALAQ